MIFLVAAYAKNKVIGNNGRLPWNIPEDLKRFKTITLGGTVIVGRRTFESMGGPLPGRRTVVLSRTAVYAGAETARSLAEAVAGSTGNVFIAGGAQAYREAMETLPIAAMYMTEIDAQPQGDTFFPEFDESRYIKKVQAVFDGDPPFSFVTYKPMR